VTGANGFLGRSIVGELVGADLPTWGTDIGAGLEGYCIRYKRADITRSEGLVESIKGAGTVIHAAGLAHIFSPDSKTIDRFHQINCLGTENLAKAAAQADVEHVVLISSVSVYGPYTHGVYDEETPCVPVGPYAESKYEAELRAAEIARQSGMALTILRLATLYGEGDPGNIKRLIRSIDRGRFVWIGDGRNRKSLLFRGDAAMACRLVATRPASGICVFNVSGPPCTMREIVDTIARALRKRPLPGRVPASVALSLSRILAAMPGKKFKGVHGTVKKWLAEDVYDTKRFEEAFRFKPEVGIEEGLRREVAWYRSAPRLNTQSARFNGAGITPVPSSGATGQAQMMAHKAWGREQGAKSKKIRRLAGEVVSKIAVGS